MLWGQPERSQRKGSVRNWTRRPLESLHFQDTVVLGRREWSPSMKGFYNSRKHCHLCCLEEAWLWFAQLQADGCLLSHSSSPALKNRSGLCLQPCSETVSGVTFPSSQLLPQLPKGSLSIPFHPMIYPPPSSKSHHWHGKSDIIPPYSSNSWPWPFTAQLGLLPHLSPPKVHEPHFLPLWPPNTKAFTLPLSGALFP